MEIHFCPQVVSLINHTQFKVLETPKRLATYCSGLPEGGDRPTGVGVVVAVVWTVIVVAGVV